MFIVLGAYAIDKAFETETEANKYILENDYSQAVIAEVKQILKKITLPKDYQTVDLATFKKDCDCN